MFKRHRRLPRVSSKPYQNIPLRFPSLSLLPRWTIFRGIQRESAREKYEPTTYEASPQERVELDNKYTAYAQTEIVKRLGLIEREMASLDEGRFDACVAVARNASDIHS